MEDVDGNFHEARSNIEDYEQIVEDALSETVTDRKHTNMVTNINTTTSWINNVLIGHH